MHTFQEASIDSKVSRNEPDDPVPKLVVPAREPGRRYFAVVYEQRHSLMLGTGHFLESELLAQASLKV